ncbi:MAG TPA: polysaccharide deacetylase family protein [Steroidobacteraceae bacterium]|nr:polysaccharide deacetylase family protein [Steroidobacteraceae bacterium]
MTGPTPSSPSPARWRPAPLIYASLGLHAGAVAAVLVRPSTWPWAVGAALADHILLTAAGLTPRSALLGPNWTRLPSAAAGRREIAITLDDGPDPRITPRVLDLLDERRTKATFFCIGERVQRHAELAREMVRRGHSVENHSQRHLNYFSLLGPRGLVAEIERAQDTIGITTGQHPLFFRAPAGLRSPFLDPVLSRLGLRLASWTRRGFDTVSASAETVLGKLTRDLAAGDILLLHDGHAALTGRGVPVILEVLPRLLDSVAASRLTPITLRAALTPASREPHAP